MNVVSLLIAIGLVVFIFWLLKPDPLTSGKIKRYVLMIIALLVLLIVLLYINSLFS